MSGRRARLWTLESLATPRFLWDIKSETAASMDYRRDEYADGHEPSGESTSKGCCRSLEVAADEELR